MKHRFLTLSLAVLGTLAAGLAQAAPTCTIGAGNVGITSLNCAYDASTSTITVTETFGNAGLGSIQFSGLDAGVNYTVHKVITNGSGIAFNRIANELLDPRNDGNDTQDPAVQPAFVPAGFSTSNDFDGLSFAQGSGRPRTSSVFASVLADEFTDARDFLDYFNGVLANGATDNFMTFGLRDNNATNQPFLLVERPNEFSVRVPEPGSMLLVALAMAGLVATRRRSR